MPKKQNLSKTQKNQNLKEDTKKNSNPNKKEMIEILNKIIKLNENDIKQCINPFNILSKDLKSIQEKILNKKDFTVQDFYDFLSDAFFKFTNKSTERSNLLTNTLLMKKRRSSWGDVPLEVSGDAYPMKDKEKDCAQLKTKGAAKKGEKKTKKGKSIKKGKK